LEKISVGFYNSHSVKVKTEIFSGADGISNLKQLFNSDANDFLLYDISMGSDEIRGVLAKGQIEMPNIISGRCFSSSDFLNNKKVAIIGRNRVDKTFSDGEKILISLFGDKYEVIGVMGYGNQTFLDNCIYYNLDSVSEGFLYYIDGKNYKSVQKALNVMKGIGETEIISDKMSGINRMFKYNVYNSEILRWGLIFTVILLLATCYFIINDSKKEIHIYFFLGFSKYQALTLVYKHFVSIVLIGWLLAAFIYIFTVTNIEGLKGYIPYFSSELMIIPIVITIFSLIVTYLVFEFYWNKKYRS
jgi:hypothetical protein